MVSQDVILFDDTIKNNISYAKDDATFDEIKKACKFAEQMSLLKSYLKNTTRLLVRTV